MKKKILFIFILLLLIFLSVYFLLLSRNIEGFIDDKIQLIDWWGDDLGSKKLFEKIFSGVFDKYDTIQVYNCSGNSKIEKHPRILNVQYSGESYYREPKDFDINFIPVNETAKNIHVLPCGSLYLLTHEYYNLNELMKPRIYSPKEKFCLFAVSNGSSQPRNEMFTELSKYKKVDSCGTFMNNMDKPCPGNWWEKEYCDFISQYKFMICFENTSQPNYFTEKCINAFCCGTIPIYWGCTNIDEHIDRDAILYLSPNYTHEERDALIEKIIYLDNNEEAYRSMFEKPLFKEGVLSPAFDVNQIREKVEKALL